MQLQVQTFTGGNSGFHHRRRQCVVHTIYSLAVILQVSGIHMGGKEFNIALDDIHSDGATGSGFYPFNELLRI